MCNFLVHVAFIAKCRVLRRRNKCFYATKYWMNCESVLYGVNDNDLNYHIVIVWVKQQPQCYYYNKALPGLFYESK